MLRAFLYALRFLVVATVVAMVLWVLVGGLTQSESMVAISIAVANAFVLFDTVDRFVDAKLAADYDLGGETPDDEPLGSTRIG